jgi:ubiquinone/menaquinone biosynthesis C-methylase UbiE
MFEKSYMSYNKEFWDKYADENEARYNEEFAKYTRDLATSLHCTSVLEIGCGTGIDLRLFTDTFQIHGIDLNDNALDIAKKKLPIVNFKKGSITDLPFEDSSIDFVFTHQLLNYLDDDILEKGVAEMYRVAGKYIMNCEKFEETEKQIDENHKFRNMYKRWMNYNVKIVSHVDMHEDIEPDKARFTLLRKL